MRQLARSVCTVIVMLLGGLVANAAAPAAACGCGAYIPDQSGAAVTDERALIAWDGTTEHILMSFNVSGNSDKAAWIMPVPSAAEVSLGDSEVFDEIRRVTAPRVEYRDSWWPTFSWLSQASAPMEAGAPSGASVNVLDRRRIGPFDVTRVAANDPGALAEWLADKGFPHPDGLNANLAPYVADGWEIVAIQLAPASQGESLTGDLQPLKLSFGSDRVVYPMRLSAAATTPQTVDLSILADHRMDPAKVPVSGVRPILEYAGQIQRGDVSPALASYIGERAFLTRWHDYIGEPALIDGDYTFEQATSDTPYQHVIYRTRNRGDLTGAILLAVIASAAVVIVVAAARRAAKPKT